MSLRIPDGFAEAWWMFNVTGDPEPMLVSLGLDLATGFTPTQGATDFILGAPIARFQAMISSAYTVRGSHIIYGNSTGDLRFDNGAAAQAGLRNPNAVPNNSALLLRKTTGVGGRRGRGRMFVPGVPEGDLDNLGVLSGTYQPIVNTAAAGIITDLAALVDVDACCLLHQSAPFTPTTITAMTADTRVATQRRRLRP